MSPRERAVWFLLLAFLVGFLFDARETAIVDQQSAPVDAELVALANWLMIYGTYLLIRWLL